MLRRILRIVVPLCLVLLVACAKPTPTAVPVPTEDNVPTATARVVPTEEPKATQAPQENTTGNPALDAVIDENKPSGAYEFGAKYTAKEGDKGAVLAVYYPIQDFWTLLGMLKVSYAAYIKTAPALFEADPDLDILTITYQKPADAEKEEVGPQPVIIIEVSRAKVAQIKSDIRWCDLKNAVDKLEMTAEAADSWKGFCP
ncbi:MAG: hypothetical protein ACYCZF_06495 [Anaerolineae bacterium]